MKHPVGLVVYNRPEHTKRVLDALAALGTRLPLYIFCDGAKGRQDAELVKAVRWLVESVTWTEPTIVRQKSNIGLARSVVNAVDTMLAEHGTMILLEDDCVPGPYLMQYMIRGLETYADDGSVISLGGYTMPLPENLLREYPYSVYFFQRIETWGWATWRRGWALYERDIAGAYARAQEQGVNLAAAGADVPGMIENRLKSNQDSWSAGWLLAALLNRKLTAYPTRSHIQNIGMDGSGVNCGKTNKWDVTVSHEPSVHWPARAFTDDRICNAVREYYR